MSTTIAISCCDHDDLDVKTKGWSVRAFFTSFMLSFICDAMDAFFLSLEHYTVALPPQTS